MDRVARYPLALLLRVITVSIETMKIVRSYRPLDLGDKGEIESDSKTVH